jgi:hypothetical protein
MTGRPARVINTCVGKGGREVVAPKSVMSAAIGRKVRIFVAA